MRLASAILTISIALLGASGDLKADDTRPAVVAFDAAPAGSLPPGFRVLSSSDRERGRWVVERMGTVAALGQTDLGRHGYRLAVLEDVSLSDVHVGVRLRVGSGDLAAGVAWRVQDARNYYAARLDLDDREVVLYKFVHGSRVRLDKSSDVRLDPGAWHEMVVEHVGTKIRVWVNGVPVASDRDDSLLAAGTVGFWMPGDGTAHFERLWHRPLPGR